MKSEPDLPKRNEDDFKKARTDIPVYNADTIIHNPELSLFGKISALLRLLRFNISHTFRKHPKLPELEKPSLGNGKMPSIRIKNPEESF